MLILRQKRAMSLRKKLENLQTQQITRWDKQTTLNLAQPPHAPGGDLQVNGGSPIFLALRTLPDR